MTTPVSWLTNRWALIGLAFVAVALRAAEQPQVYNLAYQSAPADNPLKGFVPYDTARKDPVTRDFLFPCSLEFFYLPLKDLQTGFTTFSWTALENKLVAISARHHQAVFRVYLDYPNQPYGVPAFLSGVPKYSYTNYNNGTTNTSYCPDYSNADLRLALGNFIAALGARYDGDPRIGYITVGLLGFWGEWHTSGHPDYMPSTTVMTEVLDAFQQAFPRTILLAREPKTGINMDRPNLGFHDDSFCYQTLANNNNQLWYFWAKMQTAGLDHIWSTRPIGGEIRPEIWTGLFEDPSAAPAGEDFNTCVDTTHATWMMYSGAFTGTFAGEKLARTLAGAKRLGYELYVPQATLSPVRQDSPLQGTITIRNQGVAPFYYPWRMEIGVLNDQGTVTAWPMTWDIREVMPASADTHWSFSVESPNLAVAHYKLLLRVVNPMTGGKALAFANTTQGQDKPEWLTIGDFTVPPAVYATWRSANFGANAGNDAIAGPLADPDGAGVTNFQRYAFDLPARGLVANPVTLGSADTPTGRVLTLTFPRRAVATDLSYVVESSNDLVIWTPVSSGTYAPGAGPITAKDNVALDTAGTSRRFLRLRITASP